MDESRAVTVKLKAAPVVAPAGALTAKCVAVAAVTVMLLLVPVMLAVTGTGHVEVIVEPPTTSPRRNPKKRARLIAEHRRRKGDPYERPNGRACEYAIILWNRRAAERRQVHNL